jgi:sugar phosphate isomerase/epimerase
MNVRLAFSQPTSGDDEQRTLFSGFRAAGYEGLQLKASQYVRYLNDPARFVAEWGSNAPGATSALIWGGRLDEEGTASLRRLFAFANAVGAERIIFCHGVPRREVTPDELRAFARVLSDLGHEARQEHGVALSLHHHFDQPVMHKDDFAVFFDAADPAVLGLTLDTAHLVKSGILDIAGIVRDYAAVLDNVHLKDFADGQWRVLGEGAIPFTPVFDALRAVGYAGWLCADEESGSDTQTAMETCCRFLRAHLAAAHG